MECLTDIRDSEFSASMNRTRDVINTMEYSSWTGGPITTDHENLVKSYSCHPSMLGKGHVEMDPKGPVWVSSIGSPQNTLFMGAS